MRGNLSGIITSSLGILIYLLTAGCHPLLALPSLSVSWKDSQLRSFKLSSTATSESAVRECIEEGYSFENRFEVKVCKRGLLWFESCSKDQTFISQVTQDPVTLQYALRSDTLGDGEDPQEIVLPTILEAYNRLITIAPVALTSFIEVPSGDRNYLSARITESCKGSVSPTLRRVSQLLTLGLLDIRGVDSGWIAFPLSEQ